MCKKFTEEIRTKSDYFFAASFYYAVRFENAEMISHLNDMIFGIDKKPGGWQDINRICKENNPDWLDVDIPFTKMIRNYSVASGFMHFPTIPPFRQIEADFAMDFLRIFWQSTMTQLDRYPKLQYGNNDAIDLIRLANVQLVTQWLDSLAGQKFGLATLEPEMKNLKGNIYTRKLYTDIFCQDEIACTEWKDRTPTENIIETWKQAVSIQDDLNYNEPPDWYYTTRESLGFAYLKALKTMDKKSAGATAALAETTFQQDLYNNRKSGRSICGLIQSLDVQEKTIPLQLKEDFKVAWANANISANMNLDLGEQALLNQVRLMGSQCLKRP